MRIAFVHAPFGHKKFAENLKTVDEEFCVAPPVVLAYVAAIAEEAGHEVMLLDCRVHELTKAEAAEKVREFAPDLLAFRFDTYNFHQTLSWARYLKRELGVPVLAGGINFSLYPREAMRHKVIDLALQGDVLHSLPQLLEALEPTLIDANDSANKREGKKEDSIAPADQGSRVTSINNSRGFARPIRVDSRKLNAVPGLIYRATAGEDKGRALRPPFAKALRRGKPVPKPGLGESPAELVINEPAKPANFDDFPFPARHLLDNELYSSYLTQRTPYTIMLTTTGCPYNCTFCAIAPLPYRVRSAENVLAEIKECVEKYGIKEIDFFDATFFLPRKRALKIFKGIQEAGWNIEWACRSRVDVVDDEILREAAKAGCARIYFGIESSHSDVLETINKEIDVDEIQGAIDLAHKNGIKVMGFFMVGNPGETIASINDSVRFAKELDLDFVQFSRTIAKPGTQLANELSEETGRDYWAEFVRGNVGEERLPTPWTDLTHKEQEKQTKLAYYKFYFRPGFVLKTIYRARSLREIWRYIRVGFRMLGNYFNRD